jgi:hypothetical protein
MADTVKNLSRPRNIKKASDIPEWPHLVALEVVEADSDQSIQFFDYPRPTELESISISAPKDVVRIVQESLNPDQYHHPTIRVGGILSDDSSETQSIAESRSLSTDRDTLTNDSSSQLSRHSVSPSDGSRSSTKHAPQYSVAMGPLGWLVTHNNAGKSVKKQKSPKARKEPKEPTGLRKFLKERNERNSTGSVNENCFQ